MTDEDVKIEPLVEKKKEKKAKKVKTLTHTDSMTYKLLTKK